MYEQIAARLKNEILEKKFGSSGNIGTHTQLAEEFGVSLITVRKAVQLLVDEGLLDVVQGKGTFVKNTVLQDDLTRLTGASNIILESHLSAKVDVAAFEIIDTPPPSALSWKRGWASSASTSSGCICWKRPAPPMPRSIFLANTEPISPKLMWKAAPSTSFMRKSFICSWAGASRPSGLTGLPPRQPRLYRSPKAGRCSPSAAGPITPRGNWWNT